MIPIPLLISAALVGLVVATGGGSSTPKPPRSQAPPPEGPGVTHYSWLIQTSQNPVQGHWQYKVNLYLRGNLKGQQPDGTAAPMSKEAMLVLLREQWATRHGPIRFLTLSNSDEARHATNSAASLLLSQLDPAPLIQGTNQ